MQSTLGLSLHQGLIRVVVHIRGSIRIIRYKMGYTIKRVASIKNTAFFFF